MGGMPDLGGMMGGGDSDDEEGEESQVKPHTDEATATDSTKPADTSASGAATGEGKTADIADFLGDLDDDAEDTLKK